MAKRILQIIESAYRANIEEQDDPAVWISHTFKAAGGDVGVLLRGNATNYAVRNQDASGLTLGGKVQTQPPRIADDIAKLVTQGIDVYVVEDDASERGIEPTELLAGVKHVSRAGLPSLFAGFDQVWHW